MATIRNYEDYDIWKNAIALAKLVYEITNNDKFIRDRNLMNQMRRAVISISSNIAEGHGRNNNNEFIRFLDIAKASAAEVKSQFYLAKELEFVSYDVYESNKDKFEKQVNEIGRFITYLRSKRKEGEFRMSR